MAQFHIHAGSWFIKNDDLRIVDQGFCQLEAPLHSAGELTQAGVAFFGQAQSFQEAFNPWPGFGFGDTIIPGLEIQQAFNREEPVHRQFLGCHSNLGAGKTIILERIPAKYFRNTAVLAHQSCQDADGGGLPGTVGSQQSVEFTIIDGNINPPKRLGIAVGFFQSPDSDGRCHASVISKPMC